MYKAAKITFRQGLKFLKFAIKLGAHEAHSNSVWSLLWQSGTGQEALLTMLVRQVLHYEQNF